MTRQPNTSTIAAAVVVVDGVWGCCVGDFGPPQDSDVRPWSLSPAIGNHLRYEGHVPPRFANRSIQPRYSMSLVFRLVCVVVSIESQAHRLLATHRAGI